MMMPSLFRQILFFPHRNKFGAIKLLEDYFYSKSDEQYRYLFYNKARGLAYNYDHVTELVRGRDAFISYRNTLFYANSLENFVRRIKQTNENQELYVKGNALCTLLYNDVSEKDMAVIQKLLPDCLTRAEETLIRNANYQRTATHDHYSPKSQENHTYDQVYAASDDKKRRIGLFDDIYYERVRSKNKNSLDNLSHSDTRNSNNDDTHHVCSSDSNFSSSNSDFGPSNNE